MAEEIASRNIFMEGEGVITIDCESSGEEEFIAIGLIK